MKDKIRIGIFGGSGYGGSELLRILLFHPNVDLVFVTANEQAGKAIGEVHRNLNGLTDLNFIKDPEGLNDVDCVFLALPHGQAMEIVPRLPANVKAIDLSGDFDFAIKTSSRGTTSSHTQRCTRSRSLFTV